MRPRLAASASVPARSPCLTPAVAGGLAGSGIKSTGTTVTANTGMISGGANGIAAGTLATVSNAGTILGVNGVGIGADTVTVTANSGMISGGANGIGAGTVNVTANTGMISGGAIGINAGAA